MIRSYIVRGITREGINMVYTGKAGQSFIDTDRTKAFVYMSEEKATSKAWSLNRMTSIHGIHFESEEFTPFNPIA